MKKEGLVMTVTRNLMLEQAFSDRIISTLKHHDNGSSMAIDLIEKTTQELAKTAAVNQDVYDFALQYVEEQVNFFEKQSSLINTLHSFFTAMPPEVRVMYNTFLGDTKGAAYMVICKHLDPQFNPPWTYLNLGDIPGSLRSMPTLSYSVLLGVSLTVERIATSELSIRFVQTSSQEAFAFAFARYSYSALYRDSTVCFLLFQDTRLPPTKTQYPVVDLQLGQGKLLRRRRESYLSL